MTTGKVESLIGPILDEMDYELVDIEYLSERGKWVLRIYVDKEGGLTLDDCARVSSEIGDLIDVKDIFQHKYVLEVSSPGLEKSLKKGKLNKNNAGTNKNPKECLQEEPLERKLKKALTFFV